MCFTRYAVVRSDILHPLGYLPDAMPAHQLDLLTKSFVALQEGGKSPVPYEVGLLGHRRTPSFLLGLRQ